MAWVKLLASKTIMGKPYHVGEWVEIGTDTALKWIAAKHAEALPYDGMFTIENAGIVHSESTKKAKVPFKNIPVGTGDFTPCFERNLFLNAPYSFADRDSPDVIRNIGKLYQFFELLKTWDVILVLSSFQQNASKAVSDAEGKLTKALVHDLRVPYYQQCVIGARDNEAGRAFLEALRAELPKGRILASLRAIYRVKPLVYYLPPNFGKGESHGK